MQNANMLAVRRWLIGSFAVFVLAAASGFSSCSNYALLPIFGPVTVNPTSLTFSCQNFSPQPFSASQSNFTGTFTAQSQNTSVATVAATSPPGTFSVTRITTSGGTTSFVVAGGDGLQASVAITVNGCVCVRHKDMWKDR